MADSRIVVSICGPADMARASAVHFDGMGRDHPLIDETYPRHFATDGRCLATRRHCDPAFRADPNLHHLKLSDPSVLDLNPAEIGVAGCNPFIGYGRWQVKPRGAPALAAPISANDLGNWWPARRDKEFVAWAITGFTARRRAKMAQLPQDQSLYCECMRQWPLLFIQIKDRILAVDVLAVAPGFQGRGAGGAFIKWGTDQADREGAECCVESSVKAEQFYAKYGFESLEHVRLVPPPEYSDKGVQEFIWMVRPARKVV